MDNRTAPPLPEPTSYRCGVALFTAEQVIDYAIAAIEDAQGANDPANYPAAGYEVDAAGTFKG